MRMRGSRTGRILAGAVLAAGLSVVSLGTAHADEANRGHHGAIWAADAPEHGYGSGNEWGPAVSAWAKTEAHDEGSGVSEGVHLAKGQPVPGQNK